MLASEKIRASKSILFKQLRETLRAQIQSMIKVKSIMNAYNHMLWIQNKAINITYVNHSFLHVIFFFMCSYGLCEISENNIYVGLNECISLKLSHCTWCIYTSQSRIYRENCKTLSRPLSGIDEWGQRWCYPSSFPMGAIGSLGNIL